MLDVLWMYQVFFASILIVVFLEMMDLVFVLVVAVVARTDSEVWQATIPLFDVVEPFLTRDAASMVFIEEVEHVMYDLLLVLLCHVPVCLVVQTVETADLVRGPNAVIVEIMECEEGNRVKIVNVVFLCANTVREYNIRAAECLPRICSVAQSFAPIGSCCALGWEPWAVTALQKVNARRP